jgi:hypothetical protein
MQVAVIHSAFEDAPNTVAFVEVGERTGDEALEYAYRRTNNIQGSWSRGQIMGLRSTSMGDMMVLGNKKYKVAMCGFEEIV